MASLNMVYKWPQIWQGQDHCDLLDFSLSSFFYYLIQLKHKHMIWQIDADYVLVLMDLQEDYNYAVARVPLHNYTVFCPKIILVIVC